MTDAPMPAPAPAPAPAPTMLPLVYVRNDGSRFPDGWTPETSGRDKPEYEETYEYFGVLSHCKRRDDDDGSVLEQYDVAIPDVHCACGAGETPEEALADAADTLKWRLYDLQESWEPMPTPRSRDQVEEWGRKHAAEDHRYGNVRFSDYRVCDVVTVRTTPAPAPARPPRVYVRNDGSCFSESPETSGRDKPVYEETYEYFGVLSRCVRQDDEDGSEREQYDVTVPDVYCTAGSGDTPEEALADAADTLKCRLHDLQDSWEPMPTPRGRDQVEAWGREDAAEERDREYDTVRFIDVRFLDVVTVRTPPGPPPQLSEEELDRLDQELMGV